MKIRLEEIRGSRNLSKRKLSRLSGVTRSYITELESGKYLNPGIEVLCKLSIALECSLDDLVDCENDKKK